jgi:hypothetical protein
MIDALLGIVLFAQDAAPAPRPDAAAPAPRPDAATPAPRPAVSAPATLVPPPFVPQVGAEPARGGQSTGAMPPPYFPGARQFLVQPGQTWKHLIADLEPGDEVIFPPGFHLPQVIDGLRGTAERPIFLRSRDRIPAAIVCESEGWTLRRPQHVVIENLLFINPNAAALTIDGTAPDGQPTGTPWRAEVTVRNCTVTSNRKDEGLDAFRVRNASDVRLDKLRVDGWNDAAVDLENARRVLVRALMAVPVDGMRSAVGVRVAGSSGEISVTGCAFNKRIADGVVVGSGAPASLPVERMRVDRCIFEDPGCAVRIANARDLVISRATVVNPTRAMYEIAEDAVSVSEVLVEKCLGYWTPGMLARFSPHPDRIPATAVTLADNLWYSRELPEAWDVLGAPFGYQSSGQVTQLDPGIDVQTLKPRNGEAIRYGAFSIASSSAGRPVAEPADPADAIPMRAPAAAEPAPAPPAGTPQTP